MNLANDTDEPSAEQSPAADTISVQGTSSHRRVNLSAPVRIGAA